ncbi:putative reverse transcriptase domain-containing protein [Tanacetum coccineum]
MTMLTMRARRFLKNTRKKLKDLKNRSFDSIQKMFDKAFKRQKVDEDKDTAELQSLMEVIPDKEEVAINVVPLATKPPTIVDWKIHKEGKKSYYQIVRADRKSQMYRVFSLMLKSFSREDLEDLYKLYKVNAAKGVNATSEEVSTAELVRIRSIEEGSNKKDANIANLEVAKDGVVPSVMVASGNTQVENMGHVSTGLSTVVDLMMEKDKLSSLEDTTVLESFPPLSAPFTMASNAPGKSSYANITGKPSGKKVNVRTLFTPEGNGIDVVVLMDSIRAISERFANTAYGFFLGKKVPYHVVANYVMNTWGKYGLVRSMFSSSTRLFSFQFSSIDGLDAMFENDSCVPVTAFSEDGLSAIPTKLGTPLMLDSYTSDMCMQSWGRSSYARVMIELRVDVKLKEIIVAMPKITREGHYTCNVSVEYEWKPPRCSSCKIFGHIHEECLKNTGAGEKKTVKKPSQTS